MHRNRTDGAACAATDDLLIAGLEAASTYGADDAPTALALAAIVRLAIRLPKGSAGRVALAEASRPLRLALYGA